MAGPGETLGSHGHPLPYANEMQRFVKLSLEIFFTVMAKAYSFLMHIYSSSRNILKRYMCFQRDREEQPPLQQHMEIKEVPTMLDIYSEI
jgi:hypothetical protein